MQNITWQFFQSLYENAMFVYCTAIFMLYALLAMLSYVGVLNYKRKRVLRDQVSLVASPLTPGISVIAPAFNEGVTIIYNVRSLLTLNYPRFEVIIVNDGSTDDTLTKLIAEFELVQVPYAYYQQIPSQPVKAFYKSTNQAYAKLLVIDKINGKSKADAVNAGINAAHFNYFLNTDVDCILDPKTLLKLIQPFMDEEVRVIATGATLRMVNSCEVDAGMITRVRPPRELLPRFQEVEYIRSFVLGKTGWSMMNAVPNVSGGLGLFDKEIVIKAGGYDPASFGEDMDMMIRMAAYMCREKEPYAIRYVPETLCWTEGPSTLKIYGRQRTRWGRGLLQIFGSHFKILFNPKYKRLGWIVFPYNFFFELLAPIIETVGILYYIYIVVTGKINWEFALILLVFIYTYSILITTMAICWDKITTSYYKTWKEAASLCLMAFIEPLLYHPLVVFFALKGYCYQLFGKKHSWGNMLRKGFKQQVALPSPHK
ncbi:cellulose synthase/poly-beta-1,6-N-acetylglucosamine synthase-like glycosyltransferase [Chitinophaga skermanii]|uniref:Cellulose synthase/poly-beta-1,6-N-acetylglucosamine synthase-like glycosyltransferase n=1 Tax=Chitinophaga skermanii TaxID=331697 RepID=A0A327QUY1_9BACT|nr:glycosyltransferase [Chitinophaga skermanii]RAJ08486.1 cellulose synthase/poly-beta-1,6-N-acetylglucosamine synthase-like glycosyltransferase [Chitinophaga skermanii]